MEHLDAAVVGIEVVDDGRGELLLQILAHCPHFLLVHLARDLRPRPPPRSALLLGRRLVHRRRDLAPARRLRRGATDRRRATDPRGPPPGHPRGRPTGTGRAGGGPMRLARLFRPLWGPRAREMPAQAEIQDIPAL